MSVAPINAICDRDTVKAFWRGIFEAIEKGLLSLEDTYEKVFVGIGWIPEVIPSKVVQRTVDLYNSGETTKAERLYRKYSVRAYNGEMVDKLLEAWKDNEHIQSRIHIIEEAIMAHQLGMYYLSVPVLCAQIEGHVYEMSNYVGKSRLSNLEEILGNKERYSYLSKVLQRFVKDILHEKFNWGDGGNQILSRNAILHGYDLKYGTKANSVKLIMLMNLVQAFN